MTGCAHEDDWLLDLLDGELSPDRLAEVEAHLAVCGDCRRAVEDYRAIIDSYRDGVPEEPLDESTARLVLSAAAMTTRRRGSRPALAAAAAVLLAAGAVGGWLLRGIPDAEPRATEAAPARGAMDGEAQAARERELDWLRRELERVKAESEEARGALAAAREAGDAGVEARVGTKAARAASSAREGITGGASRVEGAGGGSGGLAAPRWQAKKQLADDPLAGDLGL